MNKKNIYGLIYFILGIVLAITPRIIAPTCEIHTNGKVMRCHFMGNAVIGLAIGIIILAILFIVIKENRNAMGIVYANIVMGVLVILMPLKIIGTCDNPMMSCNTHTTPTIIIVSGIYLITNIIYFLKNK